MRRDVKILYDVVADTIGYIQVSMTAPALRARRDYKLYSLGINKIFLIGCFLFFRISC